MTDTNNTDGAALLPVTPKLLPCPFCGGEPELWTPTICLGDDDADVDYMQICCGCGVTGSRHRFRDHNRQSANFIAVKAHAIDTWNTRISHSLPGERDEFLTACVSEDARIIGIEHETEADWQKVHDAHVALRDRLNERIAERDKCPHKPAALTPSALSPGWTDKGREWLADGAPMSEPVQKMHELRSALEGVDCITRRNDNDGGQIVLTWLDPKQSWPMFNLLSAVNSGLPSALSGDAGEGE